MTWTHFWDMHSGGSQKLEDATHIYIEASEEEAKSIFYSRFNRNPERVTCTCCGPDYSISSDESLTQLTGYHRNCEYVYTRPDGTECSQSEAWVPCKGLKDGYSQGYVERGAAHRLKIRAESGTSETSSWGLYVPLETYLKSKSVKVIRASEIASQERTAHVPREGYIWAGDKK